MVSYTWLWGFAGSPGFMEILNGISGKEGLPFSDETICNVFYDSTMKYFHSNCIWRSFLSFEW